MSTWRDAYDSRIEARTFRKRIVSKPQLLRELNPQAKGTSPWSVLPSNVWIGYKYIVRDVDNGTHVKLELWRDLTDGANGGSWEKLYEYVDTGLWGAGQTPCIGC